MCKYMDRWINQWIDKYMYIHAYLDIWINMDRYNADKCMDRWINTYVDRKIDGMDLTLMVNVLNVHVDTMC